MFREMRRKKQLLSEEDTQAVLRRNSAGVLSVLGDGDYPYGVPLSYIYMNNTLYFHSARSGHKIDAIRNHDKVSFCVIDQDEIVPEKLTTYFRSAVVFGRARLLTPGEELDRVMLAFGEKYAPLLPTERVRQEQADSPGLQVIALDVEHMTGKEAIELVQKKKTEAK